MILSIWGSHCSVGNFSSLLRCCTM